MANTITVTIERTINLGNYENIKLTVGETRERHTSLGSSEARQELMEELMEEIDEFVSENTEED